MLMNMAGKDMIRLCKGSSSSVQLPTTYLMQLHSWYTWDMVLLLYAMVSIPIPDSLW